MWTDPASTAAASPHALWRLFEDIARWTNWDAGARLRRVAPPVEGGGTGFRVSHALQPLASGGTRVAYAIRVDGPDAATLGPLVTTDLAEVLAALKALAAHSGMGVS
jgi:hypothetical protein